MAGNVWEWCEDAWDKKAYSTLPDKDPVKAGDVAKRVVRGGAWNYSPKYLRVADRNRTDRGTRNAFTGVRCVR
jgi:formylglycine-generating enzyme required for sulfatase activity